MRPDGDKFPPIVTIERFGSGSQAGADHAKLARWGFQDGSDVIAIQTILPGVGAQTAFGHSNGALGAHPQVARTVFSE